MVASGNLRSEISATRRTGIVIYANPEVEQLRQLIAAARSQLADLDARYTKDRHAVDITRATIFQLLRTHYQARDRLRLIIGYRGNYLNILLRSGEDEAEQVAEEYEKAKAQSDADYNEAATAAANRKELSDDEQHGFILRHPKATRYPKFCHGLGQFHKNPRAILVTPIARGFVGKPTLEALLAPGMVLFVSEIVSFFRDYMPEVTSSDFLDKLAYDRDVQIPEIFVALDITAKDRIEYKAYHALRQAIENEATKDAPQP